MSIEFLFVNDYITNCHALIKNPNGHITFNPTEIKLNSCLKMYKFIYD